MPTNSNYLSVAQGFTDERDHGSHYEAADPGMLGAAEFFASVLFVKTAVLNVPKSSEVLWANVDGNGLGWSIFIAADFNLVATVTDGVGTKIALLDLSDVATEPYLGKIILATLAVIIEQAVPNLVLYCNGTRVATTALDVGGVVPAAGSKATVGVITPGFIAPALTCAIAGVGYKEVATTDSNQVTEFISAQDALDLDGAGAVVPTEFFDNRYSAKDLNQGSTVPKNIWLPRVGNVNLLKAGDRLTARSYKNLAWY